MNLDLVEMVDILVEVHPNQQIKEVMGVWQQLVLLIYLQGQIALLSWGLNFPYDFRDSS